MGPSHRVGFQGISAGTYSHYSCPLGDLPVDRKAIEKLLLDGLVSSRLEAHHEEHCLEMMLPFIISLWGKVPILPFLVSRAQPAEVTHLLEELCRAGDLICISSDLSHFLTYDKARVRDFHTLDTITDGRWDELGPHDACGYTAIAGLIKLAERRNLVASRLDYRNSGDTGGDRDRVVGYGALAYTPVDSK